MIALVLFRLVTLLPSRSIAISLAESQFSIGVMRFYATSSFSEKEEVAICSIVGFAWFYNVICGIHLSPLLFLTDLEFSLRPEQLFPWGKIRGGPWGK